MAKAKAKTSEATGTVQARHAAEAQREAEARAARADLVKQTAAEHKATAKRLEAKPTDSRSLATPDPNA